MRIDKKTTIKWFFTSAMLVLSLPVLNVLTQGTKGGELTVKNLFKTDVLEGFLSYSLYCIGVSWDQASVVVGKEGWLFLGDRYEATLQYTRGIRTKRTNLKRARGIARYQKESESWMNSRGAKTLFVIAPNKYSIYPEYHPAWLKISGYGFTDEYVDLAKEYQRTVLDLRGPFFEEKKRGRLLYYKLDSHWNQLGSYIAYVCVIDVLNEKYGLDIIPIRDISVVRQPTGGGGNSNLIKLNTVLPDDSDTEFAVGFMGIDDLIRIESIDRDTFLTTGDAEEVANKRVGVNRTPHSISNKSALNNMSLLWLRDSFGSNNSPYYHSTFRKVWEIHYAHLHGEQLKEFIEREQPDIVLYQVVERSIYGDMFREPHYGN